MQINGSIGNDQLRRQWGDLQRLFIIWGKCERTILEIKDIWKMGLNYISKFFVSEKETWWPYGTYVPNCFDWNAFNWWSTVVVKNKLSFHIAREKPNSKIIQQLLANIVMTLKIYTVSVLIQTVSEKLIELKASISNRF